MTRFYTNNPAFGHPGIEPRWTQGNKEGVGTAYTISSRVWFTLWNGAITEVYYPTVDTPQIRDLQYLMTDGESFVHEEKGLHSRTERLWQNALGYQIRSTDPEGRYAIAKDIITHPYLPCVLQHTKLEGDSQFLSQLQLYALCATHLDVGGWGNNARVTKVAGRKILVAHKGETWLAVAATVPFSQLSCGYVGKSDGWTDLANNLRMDWEFDEALDGNLALTGKLDRANSNEFTLGLAFGDCLHRVATTLFQALDTPFWKHQQQYQEQWKQPYKQLLPLEKASRNGSNLYDSSVSLLLAHEDKSYPGALIASLSIPWGQTKGDKNSGGYHFVWTRDMVNSSLGLLAAGHIRTPLESLIYLAVSQQADGGFAQNFWLNGEPHWTNIQLDQIAFPLMLAWRLHQANAIENFDPYPMILGAASYLIRYGPVTQQERWEEFSGFSPSTLASNIAGLICAACYARDRGDEDIAQFIEDYADFLECHVEAWTVTTEGTLVPDIKQHYIRINPAAFDDPQPNENPNQGVLHIAHLPPSEQSEFPAKEIVDAGFLELVRYGIRKPDDPIIVDSLRVVDAVLKVETPFGEVWRRYNHDGYGQQEDGSPFEGWGKGRAWPLLTAERGYYELAAEHDIQPFIQAMEGFATNTGLLPEQVWDAPDLPNAHMYLGRPTGAAMPLMWAHAEYIKLLRSTHDGQVFDLIPAVADRYLGDCNHCRLLEVWKFNRQVRYVKQGYTLRIQALAPFRLHWTCDDWQSTNDTDSTATRLGIEFLDIAIAPTQQSPVRFTFFWSDAKRWEERNYEVNIVGS